MATIINPYTETSITKGNEMNAIIKALEPEKTLIVEAVKDTLYVSIMRGNTKLQVGYFNLLNCGQPLWIQSRTATAKKIAKKIFALLGANEVKFNK